MTPKPGKTQEQQEQHKEKHGFKSLAVLIGITLAGGGLVALFIRNSMSFYQTLNKPSFAPPGWLFPVVWSLLYVLMSVSVWLAIREHPSDKRTLLTLYWIQLAVNLVWPILFFRLHALGLAFMWLLLLWALVLIMTLRFSHRSNLAGWLVVPYLLWISFAGWLNFMIAALNP